MTKVFAGRINHWLADLDWYDTIAIHDQELQAQILHLAIDARGAEFAKCLQFKVVNSPNDLIPLRGLKFGLTAWPESLDEFPPFVIAEYCAIKEKSDARKARK